MKNKTHFILQLAASFLMCLHSHAAPFQKDSVALLQATASANNTNAAIVEVSPTSTTPSTPLQSISINGTTLPNALRFSGSATSTGYLSSSADRSLLTFTGHNSITTGVNANTLATRGVGVINGTGEFSLAATYTGTSGNQTRSATSLNNSTWFIADQGGIYTNGSTAANPAANVRGIKTFGSTVYVAQASATAIAVSTVSSPSGGTITGLPGLTNKTDVQDFYLISSGNTPGIFDVLYLLRASSNTAGTIEKYSLVSGTWTANGSYTTTFGGFGLAAKKSDTGAVLYVSTGQGALAANSLLKITDTAGYNAVISITTANNVTLYTAPTGNIIKGVEFAPYAPFPDLSTYVRVGRYNLPEPTRTALPNGTPSHNVLCQEASAVTYNWDTDTLFITGDGGRSITQVSKTGALIDTMTLALQPGAPQGTAFYDPEGLTYIGNGQFVMSEERDRQLVKFTYTAGTTLTRAMAKTVDLGTFDDNTGTEGLSWDPQTNGFIVLKEKNPIGIFLTGVDFDAGTATNGSPTTVNSTNLFDTSLLGMTDVADVFTLSNIPSLATHSLAGNMLVLGQENARVVNISRTGVIHSTLQIVTDPGNPLSAADQQHEGITMDRDGFIYIVNENGGGNINYPQLWVYAPSALPNAAPTAIALNNPTTSILENTSTVTPIKIADIIVTDDGLGVNTLAITGADASFFEITSGSLFLKAGTVLDYETKSSYGITLTVDDTSIGATPDATVNYTLTVTDQEPEAGAVAALAITEVSPWSSGNSPVGTDWFEVTNISDNPVDITGWKVDDNSASFSTALTLNGITTIAPGESVVFLEGNSTTVNAFKTNWFGANTPAGLQVGYYSGSGIGLGASGDAVNLYTTAGILHASVSFGASDNTSPYQTFDNTIAADGVSISTLSTVGVNGAFAAANSANEVGSPGYSAPGVLRVTEVAPWGSGNAPLSCDWFEVTNVGARAVRIVGWKVDDNSESPVAAVALSGIDNIAPGESVIFMETSDLPTKASIFRAQWFGDNPPAGLQIGSYSGSGIGLSTGGDAVNLYDTRTPTPARRASVNFGIAPSAAPFATFDNTAAADVAAITLLSTIGVNNAFAAANKPNEIGSPGSAAVSHNAYQSWAQTHAQGSQPNQDADGDGVSNAVEFILGGDAATNDITKLPVSTATGDNFTFSFLRKRSSIDGGVLAIEVGTNLLQWTTYHVGNTTAGSAAGVAIVENTPDGFDTITLTVPKNGAPSMFGRLKVSVTP